MMKEQVKISAITWAGFHPEGALPALISSLVSGRTWAPRLPQTQNPLWAAKTPRISPPLMSGSGRWWKWRKKRVSVFRFKATDKPELFASSITIFILSSSAQSVHTANSGSSHAVKKVQKNFNNYASVECGAKILGSNPEAKVLHLPTDDPWWWNSDSCWTESLQSTSAILMENMDMYMLNPCSNKIWYVPTFPTRWNVMDENPDWPVFVPASLSGSSLSSVNPSRWSSWTSPTLSCSPPHPKISSSPSVTGESSSSQTWLWLRDEMLYEPPHHWTGSVLGQIPNQQVAEAGHFPRQGWTHSPELPFRWTPLC